jgi:hypothetical protein
LEKIPFLEIKSLAINSNTLYFIKPEGEIVLKTDASQLAFGGTLTQMQPNEKGELVERDNIVLFKNFLRGN